MGNQENTRCLGNYLVKGGYREFEELASATVEPIIAEPEIHGGIEIDDSCRFLMLMSRGLYKALEEATRTEQVNKEIALMAVEQVCLFTNIQISFSILKNYVFLQLKYILQFQNIEIKLFYYYHQPGLLYSEKCYLNFFFFFFF